MLVIFFHFCLSPTHHSLSLSLQLVVQGAVGSTLGALASNKTVQQAAAKQVAKKAQDESTQQKAVSESEQQAKLLLFARLGS